MLEELKLTNSCLQIYLSLPNSLHQLLVPFFVAMHYRLLEPHLVLLCCILVTEHHELIDAATDAAKGCWGSCLS